MPMVAAGGDTAYGGTVRQSFAPVASTVLSVLVEQAGRWPAAEQPEECLRLLSDFLRR